MPQPSKYLQRKSNELKKHILERGGKLFIAVDLDGTLAELGSWKGYDQIGKPRRHIVERIRRAKKIKNANITIYTCRISDVEKRILSGSLENVKTWLKKNKIPYDSIWTKPGKPFANIYLDDSAKDANCKECLKKVDQCLR